MHKTDLLSAFPAKESGAGEGAFAHLFETARMGNLTLPNRLIMAPMESNLANLDGTVSETQLDYYQTRAAGGVGMVIVEYTCVDTPLGIGGTPQLFIDDDDLIPSHARLVEAIHGEGARACLQLFHAGRQTHPKFIDGNQPVAASPIPCPMYRKMPRALTRTELETIATRFGEAARRARQAGYDAVEIHGAHGYLIGNFLSAASNQRDDEFGGSLENRQRFALMVVRAVRRAAGDMPVLFRLSADEFVDNGTDIEEAKEIARHVVAEGVDVVHVSTGCHERIDRNVEPVWMPEGCRLPLARQIREHTGAPVIAVGVIRRPEMAEQALADGSADFIALGRALLADPDWVKKTRAGAVDDIRPCTSCNWCLAQIGKGHSPIGCAENPRAGRETSAFPARVIGAGTAAVVGSGPGGLAAALTLDQAGYQVTLFEASCIVAPGLLASGAAPDKEKFLQYRDYLLRRLQASNVTVKLHCPADEHTLLELSPSVIILATGAVDRQLHEVAGLDQLNVVYAYQVLTGEAPLGAGSVVIYGAGEIGCEAAKYAADRGHEVILATRSDDEQALCRANKLRIYREQFVAKLKANPRIRIELGCTLDSVEGRTVRFLRHGETLSWQADQVLLAVGRLPNIELAEQLRARGKEVHLVGDAVAVRRIGDAVHHAYELVRDLTREKAPDGEALKVIAF